VVGGGAEPPHATTKDSPAMTRAPHYAIAAIVVAALSLALAPLALTRSQRAPAGATPAAVAITHAAGGYTVTPSSVAVSFGQRLTVTDRDAAAHGLVQVSGPHAEVTQRGRTATVVFSRAGFYTFTVTSRSPAGGKPLTVIVTR
jgi:plastocyanin